MAINENDIFKLVVDINLPLAVEARNVYYAVYTGPDGALDTYVLSAGETYFTDVYTPILDRLVGTVQIESFTAYRWTAGGWENMGTQVLDLTGSSSTTQPAPHGVAALIEAAIQVVGTLGKKFLPGFASNLFTDTGEWQSGVITDLVLTAAAYVAPFPADGAEDFQPGYFRQSNATFYPFALSGVVKATPGYQRRRKPGVGI